MSLENMVSLVRLTTNTVRAENIEDRDEYLNIRETTIHVNININES